MTEPETDRMAIIVDLPRGLKIVQVLARDERYGFWHVAIQEVVPWPKPSQPNTDWDDRKFLMPKDAFDPLPSPPDPAIAAADRRIVEAAREWLSRRPAYAPNSAASALAGAIRDRVALDPKPDPIPMPNAPTPEILAAMAAAYRDRTSGAIEEKALRLMYAAAVEAARGETRT